MNDNQNPGGPGGINPDDFEALLRHFLNREGPLDPEQLAEAAGLPKDPAAMAAMLEQIEFGLSDPGTAVDTASPQLALDVEPATAEADASPDAGDMPAPAAAEIGAELTPEPQLEPPPQPLAD